MKLISDLSQLVGKTITAAVSRESDPGDTEIILRFSDGTVAVIGGYDRSAFLMKTDYDEGGDD